MAGAWRAVQSSVRCWPTGVDALPKKKFLIAPDPRHPTTTRSPRHAIAISTMSGPGELSWIRAATLWTCGSRAWRTSAITSCALSSASRRRVAMAAPKARRAAGVRDVKGTRGISNTVNNVTCTGYVHGRARMCARANRADSDPSVAKKMCISRPWGSLEPPTEKGLYVIAGAQPTRTSPLGRRD